MQEKSPILVLRIIHLSIAFSALVLVFCAKVAIENGQGGDIPENNVISYALCVFGMLNAVVMPLVISAIYNMTSKDLEKEEKEGRFFLCHIIKCALIESATIMGFVASIMYQDMTWVIFMALISIVIFMIYFPKNTQ